MKKLKLKWIIQFILHKKYKRFFGFPLKTAKNNIKLKEGILKMKIEKIFFTICFIVFAFILFCSFNWDRKNIRTERVTVYYVTENEIVVKDNKGNLFSCWADSPNVTEGETLKASFLTNDTDTIKDDSLVGLQK